MSFDCKKCKNKQYCRDCKKETGEDIEEFDLTESSRGRKSVCNKVSMCGDHLFYKGICYTVLYQEDIEEKNGSPNLIFRTYQGLTFYLREQDNGDFILIKIVKSSEKKISSKAEEKEFKLFEKNLLGQVPEGLLANYTW